jgi:hypothetical protein
MFNDAISATRARALRPTGGWSRCSRRVPSRAVRPDAALFCGRYSGDSGRVLAGRQRAAPSMHLSGAAGLGEVRAHCFSPACGRRRRDAPSARKMTSRCTGRGCSLHHEGAVSGRLASTGRRLHAATGPRFLTASKGSGASELATPRSATPTSSSMCTVAAAGGAPTCSFPPCRAARRRPCGAALVLVLLAIGLLFALVQGDLVEKSRALSARPERRPPGRGRRSARSCPRRGRP